MILSGLCYGENHISQANGPFSLLKSITLDLLWKSSVFHAEGTSQDVTETPTICGRGLLFFLGSIPHRHQTPVR